MMAICNFAIYEVTGPVTDEHADWDALLKSSMKLQRFLMKR